MHRISIVCTKPTCKSAASDLDAAMMVSASSGGGAELRGSTVGVGLQIQGCRRVVIALLVVVSTAIVHVHCITVPGVGAPAPAPQELTRQQKIFASFNQDEGKY